MDQLIHGIAWASWKILIRIHQPPLFQVRVQLQDHELMYFDWDSFLFSRYFTLSWFRIDWSQRGLKAVDRIETENTKSGEKLVRRLKLLKIKVFKFFEINYHSSAHWRLDNNYYSFIYSIHIKHFCTLQMFAQYLWIKFKRRAKCVILIRHSFFWIYCNDSMRPHLLLIFF